MKGLRRTEGRGVTSTPWANSLLCIHQYSQVHKKLPASLAAVLGHVTEFSPMIWRKGCITLKDQLNIINFSFIRGSGCCPYPEGPWVTIQLPKTNYIKTWKGEELSFDQAKEQKRSVTWGHLNIFYNTPLLFFAFWHHRLRAIWTHDLSQASFKHPTHRSSFRHTSTADRLNHNVQPPSHPKGDYRDCQNTWGNCPIHIRSWSRRWREQTWLLFPESSQNILPIFNNSLWEFSSIYTSRNNRLMNLCIY